MSSVFTGYSIVQNTELEALTARIGNAESTVTTNNTTVTNAVGDINTKDSAQDGRLTSLESRQAGLNSRQDDIESAVTTLTTFKNGLNTVMTNITGRYDTLHTQSGVINTALGSIESTITTKLAEIATKADQTDFVAFETQLIADNGTLANMLAARILASLQALTDLGQGVRDKFFEERFFAVEEFIRATLATYEVNIEVSTGVFKKYEYTGVVQNLTGL